MVKQQHKQKIHALWKQYHNVESILAEIPELKKTGATKFLCQEIVAEIKHQFQFTRKIKTVADIIGINRKTVYAYIDRYQIEVPTIDEQAVVIDYMQGISVQNLESKYRTNNITPILKKIGLDVLIPDERTKLVRHVNGSYDTEISPYFEEVIIGSQLGDSYIDINEARQKNHGKYDINFKAYKIAIKFVRSLKNLVKNNLSGLITQYNEASNIIIHSSTATFLFHKAIEEEPWVRVLAELYRQEGFNPSITFHLNDEDKLTCNLETQSSVILYSYFKIWYHAKKPGDDKIIKKVPSDLIITPNILLHWYIGDGSFSKWRIVLYTLGFSYEENQKLTNFLERDVDIKAVVRKTTQPVEKKKRYKDYYYLDIMGLENRVKFFEFLGKANPFVLKKAKEIFPWKFSRHLKKKDHLESLVHYFINFDIEKLIPNRNLQSCSDG